MFDVGIMGDTACTIRTRKFLTNRLLGRKQSWPELVTTLQDDNTVKNRTSELLNEHDSTLRQERLMEPGRGRIFS